MIPSDLIEKKNARDRLILEHREYARRLAVGAARECGADISDAVGDAMVALVETAGRFDPGRGVTFKTFLHRRVLGAVVDGERRWSGRGEEERSRRRHCELTTGIGERIADGRELPEAALLADAAVVELLAPCTVTQRAALTRLYVDDWPAALVARERGTSVVAVYWNARQGGARVRARRAA